ncbi:unnamed protein product [Chilo suppressalis]|uniref:Reverse transcriptase domain-containing protein n=1 Tax=Chilo suppressalis TaxID=168631 RepID=A0ABN8B843_CHISP|nr:unnamed protein product [Chilo suppressalis]
MYEELDSASVDERVHWMGGQKFIITSWSRLHLLVQSVRPPPYRKVDVECAEAGDSKPHVTAHNLCGDLNRGDIPRNPMGQSVDGEPYPLASTGSPTPCEYTTLHNLCGDLNRGDIPRNPMGQSVDGEPYPLASTGSPTPCEFTTLHNLCGDLNRGDIPRNPMGQSVDGEPYPLASTGSPTPCEYTTLHNLCGDLNRGDIPRNPMGQSVDGEPYPFELIRNHTLRFLSRALPALRNDDSLPRVTRLPATPTPTRPDPGYIQHNGPPRPQIHTAQRVTAHTLHDTTDDTTPPASPARPDPGYIQHNGPPRPRIHTAQRVTAHTLHDTTDDTTPPASPARPDPGYIQHNGPPRPRIHTAQRVTAHTLHDTTDDTTPPASPARPDPGYIQHNGSCTRESKVVLKRFYYSSYSLGCGTETWRDANMHLVPKTGNRSDLVNYRPIAVTSVISSPRKASPIDKRGKSLAIDLYIAKAFDRVWHKSLVSKLPAYGLPAQFCSWVPDFLHELEERSKRSASAETESQQLRAEHRGAQSARGARDGRKFCDGGGV